MAGLWDCPVCGRRVPSRALECHCGTRRPAAVAAPHGVPAWALAGWGVAGLALAGVGALLVARTPPPATVPPAPTTSTTLPFRPLPTTLAQPSLAERWTPEPAAEASPAPAEVAVAPSPTPSPSPTESERRREAGLAALDASLAGLTPKVGQLQERLRLHQRECNNVGWAHANPADCRQLEDQLRRESRELVSAVDAAEEVARQAGLPPGVRRERRSAARLSETDLDALCREIEATLPH